MARHKAAVNCQILPWLSKNADCKEGRFLQIGNSICLSKEFQSLSSGAQITYIFMALEAGTSRKFIFTHTTAKKYGIASRSFDRYMKELVENRFITLSSGKNTRTPNEFEFSFAWKFDDAQKKTLSHGNISCKSSPKWRSSGEKVNGVFSEK